MGTEPGQTHHTLELLRKIAADREVALPSISSILDTDLRLPPHDGGSLERGVEIFSKATVQVSSLGNAATNDPRNT